jgi:hypothetical protein
MLSDGVMGNGVMGNGVMMLKICPLGLPVFPPLGKGGQGGSVTSERHVELGPLSGLQFVHAKPARSGPRPSLRRAEVAADFCPTNADVDGYANRRIVPARSVFGDPNLMWIKDVGGDEVDNANRPRAVCALQRCKMSVASVRPMMSRGVEKRR